MTVAGSDGWLFLTNELRHLGAGDFWGPEAAKVSRAARPQDADPLPAILDFQKQLAAAGIELVMLPVPPKALVHADRLLPPAKLPPPASTALGQFHELLRSKGVAVLDLTADFAEAAAAGREPYCRQDSHWSGLGC
jgi:alginate O-acetyltransferase complex protein AlgJ